MRARISPPRCSRAIPGFAQFKSLSDSIDDVVSYDDRQLPALSRAILAVHGAGHVVIERQLMAPADGDRARRIADALLGAAALRDQDGQTLHYEVPRVHEAVAPALWLDSEWGYLERRDERDPFGRALRWRWMSNRARLGIVTADATSVTLRLTLQALNRARRLRLAIDGSEIATLLIATDRAVYESPAFSVPSGASFIELSSLDGAESPGADVRRLSVAIFDAALVGIH